MSKIMYDGGRADKNENLIARIGIGVIFGIVFLLMWVINPHENKDVFTSETLWECVHPYNWFFDTVATIAWVWCCLFLSGMASIVYKKVYSLFQPEANTAGPAPIVTIVCALLMLLYYV